jgi:long-chain acyl-CoA synthetase
VRSAPVPAEVLRKFEETFGCLVIEGLRLIESTAARRLIRRTNSETSGSCGKPIGNEMKIFDETDAEVPAANSAKSFCAAKTFSKVISKMKEANAAAFRRAAGFTRATSVTKTRTDFSTSPTANPI